MLAPQQLAALRGELWRGTIAGVAYYWLRNPAVHGIGASVPLSFGNTTVAGAPAQPLTFARLHAALTHLVAELRRRSEATNEWFGNDQTLA